MHANTYFCIVMLGCELANFLHWGAERDEQFHYLPQSGWLWTMMVLLIAATIAETFLHLTGVATSPNLLRLLCAFTSFQAIYSIALRHQLRKQKDVQQVVELPEHLLNSFNITLALPPLRPCALAPLR